MSIEPNGQNLIFLISQPRSGSTMLQRMLGSHPDIHTTAEPWTMLHSIYGLRQTGYQAEYNEQSAWLAVNDFIRQLPHQKESYLEGVRRMHMHLYNAALEGTGKRCFLDKTPRYYHVIPELKEIFPDATFVILLRNPLAVACSVLNAWVKDNWFKLYKYRADLLDAPQLLLAGKELLGDRAVTVSYEALLTNPEAELKQICHHIGVEFLPDLIQYNRPHDGSPRSLQMLQNGFGYKDQKTIFHQGKLDKGNLHQWVNHLDHPQWWRILHDYYYALGEDTLQSMGISSEELHNLLEQYRPTSLKLAFTFSLYWLTRRPEERQSWPYEHQIIKLIRLFQRRGLSGGIIRMIQKGLNLDTISNQKASIEQS